MKILRDTWLVFGRYLGLFLRNPVWVVIGVVQPLLYLLLFAPLLKSIAAMPGFPPGGAYNVFVPGLLIQLGLFGASGVGFSLIAELRFGVVERLRVTPVSRLALLLGRALRDMLTLLIQSLLLVLVALPVRAAHPPGRPAGHAGAARADRPAHRLDLVRPGAVAEERGRVRAAALHGHAAAAAALRRAAAAQPGARAGCARSPTSTRSPTPSTRRARSSTTTWPMPAWPRAS